MRHRTPFADSLCRTGIWVEGLVYVKSRESPSVDLNSGDILETRVIWNKSDGAIFSARGLVDLYLELLMRGRFGWRFRRPDSDEDAGGGQHCAWRSNLQPLERIEIELTEAIRNRWHWRCCDSNAFREEFSNGSQCWSRRS